MISYAGYNDPVPTMVSESVGFRVAYVPEPGLAALIAASGLIGAFILGKSLVRSSN